jgi:hypothetical protein
MCASLGIFGLSSMPVGEQHVQESNLPRGLFYAQGDQHAPRSSILRGTQHTLGSSILRGTRHAQREQHVRGCSMLRGHSMPRGSSMPGDDQRKQHAQW